MGGGGRDLLDVPPRGAHFIKTGMRQTQHPPACWLEHPSHLLHGEIGLLDIHQGHITHDQITHPIFEHGEMGCICHVIENAEGISCLPAPGTRNKRCTRIHSDDPGALPGRSGGSGSRSHRPDPTRTSRLPGPRGEATGGQSTPGARDPPLPQGGHPTIQPCGPNQSYSWLSPPLLRITQTFSLEKESKMLRTCVHVMTGWRRFC
jgi:hypothetical protein